VITSSYFSFFQRSGIFPTPACIAEELKIFWGTRKAKSRTIAAAPNPNAAGMSHLGAFLLCPER
jgi:hypothetical protein